jgi:cell division septation protein DedD
VDSVLKREEEGSNGYGNALYWRGALAETAAEAERDYRRVIVEYPLSLYVDDALLALAELEQARGDRAGALAHLQRFVRDHPVSSARGIAALAAGRLAFEQRDTKTGCAMIAEARASASATDVELRNQIDYFSTRCSTAAMETAATPPAPVTTPQPARDTAKAPAPKRVATTPPKKIVPDSVKAPLTPPARPAPTVTTPRPTPTVATPRGNYTIQLAAFNTRPEAERLIAKLKKSGVNARVSGTAKPFRVRLDFYPTRDAAAAEVASLKARGIIGFVTTETPPKEKAP